MPRLLSQLAVAAATIHSVLGESFSIPLAKQSAPGPVRLPPRSYNDYITGQVPEVNQENFWFANFTVGADNFVMLIDTGSTDVYLNPGEYSPSPASINLGVDFTITFATTNSDGSGVETIGGPVYEDVVSLIGTKLSVPLQPLGVVTVPVSPPAFPNDGLVGFAGPDSSALNATSWFQSLCSQGTLDACRFGLAFETDNTGVQYFGKVEANRFDGKLSVAPLFNGEQWTLFGDVAFNGTVIEKDVMIVTDSGTTTIFGPLESVGALFDAAGIQSVTTPGNAAAGIPTTLTGFYPCDSPPTLGFGFPSISNATTASQNSGSPISHSSTIFNILDSQLAENSTDGNCTASIQGTDAFGEIWLVGQAFFQGRYIDHNLDGFTMGFANLVN